MDQWVRKETVPQLQSSIEAGKNNPKIWSEYEPFRAAESHPQVQRVWLVLVFIAFFFTIAHIALYGAGDSRALGSFALTLVVGATYFIIRSTALGNRHHESISTGLGTFMLLSLAVVGRSEYVKTTNANQECCNSFADREDLAPLIFFDHDERDCWSVNFTMSNSEETPKGVTGFYCDDLVDTTGYGGRLPAVITFFSAGWLIASMLVVLLCRIRFRYCLILAGVTGLANAAFACEAMIVAGVPPEGIIFNLISYVPGFVICLMTPRSNDRLHFANFLHHRAKDKQLVAQKIHIEDQNKVINATKEKQAAAQRIVNEVMSIEDTASNILNKYTIPWRNLVFEGSVGEGSFGTVFKGKLRGRTVAIKTMRIGKITKSHLAKFRQEICTMASLKHPNIVQMWGACWTDGPDKLCIVLEFVAGGTLQSLLVPESEVSWDHLGFGMASGIARCFTYLHHDIVGNPVIHRDLKQVADFGEAKEMKGHAVPAGHNSHTNELVTMTMVGTALFMAPEVLDGQRYNLTADASQIRKNKKEILQILTSSH